MTKYCARNSYYFGRWRNCTDIRKVVEPVLQKTVGLFIISIYRKIQTRGSSFAQTLNTIGKDAPTIKDAAFFKRAFNTIQELILEDNILAGHDIGSGGLITTLLKCVLPITI
jgi:phosphoribosylformylglycinamidine synthase